MKIPGNDCGTKLTGRRGLGLVEIIFILGIFALGLGLFSLSLMKSNYQARSGKALKDLMYLEGILEKYKEKHGQYPLTLYELQKTKPPFLYDLPRDPFYPGMDPTNFTYYYYASMDRQFYHMYSCGPNHKNDCDMDDYINPRFVSKTLGSGEELPDVDDIFVTNLQVRK